MMRVVVVVTTATVATVTAMATAMLATLAAVASQLVLVLIRIRILILGITIIDLLLLLLGMWMRLLVGTAPATGGAGRVLQQAAACLRLGMCPLLHHRHLGSATLTALVLAVGDRNHSRGRGSVVDGDRRLFHVLRVLRILGMRLLAMRMLLVSMCRWLLVHHCSSGSSIGVAVAHNVVTRGCAVGLGMGDGYMMVVRARRAAVHNVWGEGI